MSSESPQSEFSNLSAEQKTSALFAALVVQQTNTALMFLGKIPHPETGQAFRELESARMIIDQLEMLEAKTKGNLSKPEEALLRKSLMELRMAFVHEVGQGETHRDPQPPSSPSSAGPAAPGAETDPGLPAEESRKKFSKKY